MSRLDRFTRPLARLAIGVAAAICVPLVAAVPGNAAPATAAVPVEFDVGRYTPVAPERYRSLAYADNGRAYFTTGRWRCQIGPQYRYVGCQGSPATAPADTVFDKTLGAAISADQSGPWWVRSTLLYTPSYRFGPRSAFTPPLLRVGQRLTIAGVTCTVPRADEVACRTGERALIFTPAWHKFFYPAWDTKGHNANPAAQNLPPRLRGTSQLP